MNAGRRHHIPKQRHQVTNWAEYDAALRQRGSLTVWFTDAAIAAWRGSQVGPLLDQVTRPVASFTGDGAFDRDDVYDAVAERHPKAAVIVPPRSSAVLSETAEASPTQRDKHLQLIAARGRMGWQKASGYNWRALVEADISRYKWVIGDALRSRTDARQATEVAVGVLNRMLELGRPKSVRIA
jgi:hypothetical protein